MLEVQPNYSLRIIVISQEQMHVDYEIIIILAHCCCSILFWFDLMRVCVHVNKLWCTRNTCWSLMSKNFNNHFTLCSVTSSITIQKHTLTFPQCESPGWDLARWPDSPWTRRRWWWNGGSVRRAGPPRGPAAPRTGTWRCHYKDKKCFRISLCWGRKKEALKRGEWDTKEQHNSMQTNKIKIRGVDANKIKIN